MTPDDDWTLAKPEDVAKMMQEMIAKRDARKGKTVVVPTGKSSGNGPHPLGGGGPVRTKPVATPAPATPVPTPTPEMKAVFEKLLGRGPGAAAMPAPRPTKNSPASFLKGSRR